MTRHMPEAVAWLGVIAGLAALGWHIYNRGVTEGRVQGKDEAQDEYWDDGWDSGYNRGFTAARDKAIEYGVQALCD